MPKRRSRASERSSGKGGDGGGGGGPSEETQSGDFIEDAAKIAAKEALIQSTAMVNPALPAAIKLASQTYDAYKLGKRLGEISESRDSEKEKMNMMAGELLKFAGNKIIDTAIDHTVSEMMRTEGMSSTVTIISKQTNIEDTHVETFLRSSMRTGLKVYKQKVQRMGAIA